MPPHTVTSLYFLLPCCVGTLALDIVLLTLSTCHSHSHIHRESRVLCGHMAKWGRGRGSVRTGVLLWGRQEGENAWSGSVLRQLVKQAPCTGEYLQSPRAMYSRTSHAGGLKNKTKQNQKQINKTACPPRSKSAPSPKLDKPRRRKRVSWPWLVVAVAAVSLNWMKVRCLTQQCGNKEQTVKKKIDNLCLLVDFYKPLSPAVIPRVVFASVHTYEYLS